MKRAICRKTFFILAIFIISICVSSCSRERREEGYLYYRLNADPSTLDPALIVDVTGGFISAKLFNGLVRLDETLNIVPDLAEKWKISEVGTTYLFSLRKGVRFANGRELVADDVRYSFMRVLDPNGKSPNTWVLDAILGAKDYLKGKVDDISGIRVVDNYTLEIRLEKPFSPFLALLTMTAAYIVPSEETEKWGADFSVHPVGTGPYRLKRWEHNSELILERNRNYFEGQAKLQGLVYRIIPEDLTAVTEFELGNLDVITIPAYEYRRYSSSPRWRQNISSVSGLNTYYLGFNCSRPPFDNVRLRQAVAMAIDREKILTTFYEGRGRLASGPVPDVLRKWEPPVPFQYDPATARKRIDKEGMKGLVITFYITSDQEIVDIAEIIQSYLREAGLQVTIKQLEWSAYKAALNRGEADMFWISWWADYPDAENFLFPLFHSSNHGASGNRSWYTNKMVDERIEDGQRSLSDSDKNTFYQTAERIIAEESPWVFFWHKTDFTLKQDSVKNYQIYPIYTMDKGLEISF